MTCPLTLSLWCADVLTAVLPGCLHLVPPKQGFGAHTDTNILRITNLTYVLFLAVVVP
jgi:hypothetical protein